MLPPPQRCRRAPPGLAAAALALLVALAGCGSAGPPRLDTADASSLQSMLGMVRTGAQRKNRVAVLTGLAALRARVQSLDASGALPASEAHFLRSDIAAAVAAAERELSPPAPPVTVAPPVVTAPVRSPDGPHKHPKPPKPPHDRRDKHGPGQGGAGDHPRGGGDAEGGAGG